MDVQINNLVKTFGAGDCAYRALDGVTLSIGGGMFGLLGPNGAGKTTLMRIITTLLTQTSGTVSVGGVDVLRDPGAIRQVLGYIPQDFGFFKSLNAYELLDYIGTMKGLSPADRRAQIDDLLEQVNLTKDAKRRVGGYSGGMKQRLGIAQALLGNPRLLVVDEPTAGLDPEERIRFRNLLARISNEGEGGSARTVILSTHIVGDIEASCSALAVLNKGTVAFTGTPDALIEAAQGHVWQVEINVQEWDALESKYRVTSSRQQGSTITARVVTAHAGDNPLGRGVAVGPGLEDGYIAVMGQRANVTQEAVYA